MPSTASIARATGTIVACVAIAATLSSGANTSPNAAIAAIVGLSLAAAIIWAGAARRGFLIGLLFLAAPFDLSKAVYPPLDRFYSPGLYVTIGEAAMLLLGLDWICEQLFLRRQRLPFSRLDALACGFLVLVWAGALHAEGGMLAYASAVAYSLCVVGFYVVSHAVRTTADLRVALKMVVIGLALQAAYVTAQMVTHSFLTLPGGKVEAVGTQGLAYEAEQISLFRPIGGFDHPNALADYLTLLLPCALAIILMGRRRLPAKIVAVATFAAFVAAVLLLLTLSRGGWSAFLVGAGVVGTVYWRKRIIGSGHVLVFAGTALAGLLAVIAVYPQIILRLTEPDSRSTESRILLSDQALTIIEAHPIIGVGYGGYNRAAFEHTPPSFSTISEDYKKQLLKLIVHDHYLLLATELGLPTMLYWVYLMWRFARQAWPLAQWRDPGMFALSVGLSGALASQALYLALDNYYADIRVFLLWLTAGLLQALVLQVGRERTFASIGAPP